MLIKSLRFLSAVFAALAAASGIWLALDSVQFLIDQFRLTATVGILAASCGLLIASVLLVRRPRTGQFLAAACAIAAALFVVVGLSQMGSVPLGEAFAQATCPRGAGLCFPQAATFLYALAVLGTVLLASRTASWLVSHRGV